MRQQERVQDQHPCRPLLEECFFESWNQRTRADNTNHWLVGAVLIMHFMLLSRGFTGGFNQIACFTIVEVVINVNNVAFFHIRSPERFGDSQVLISQLDENLLFFTTRMWCF